MQFLYSARLILALILTVLSSSGCRDLHSEPKTRTNNNITFNVASEDKWPPIKEALACLSQTGPIISQHRGRSHEAGWADNSLSGLKALHEQGFVMAEIDLARLRDGTHILFHDGVWDKRSTGHGPVASANWNTAQKYLLVNKRGKITSDTPLTLGQLTDNTKNQLYLEIDFKSSANEKEIISHFKAVGQGDHIILIAYSRSQALRLHKLAPNALIAAPVSKIGDVRAYEIAGLPTSSLIAWLGTKTYNENLAKALKERRVYSAFGMMSPKYAKEADYSPLTLIVTDYANEARKMAGIRQTGQDRLAECNF